ncbi:hypothetical protein K1T71_005840 [Dendrolimus kikuchii]|uniref:Uncharacterized protein n=1 Tax=Dendrolimus kikuchii TaxID=765133 RepID=A0ACC1D5I4_9NEOP|nr:hypothetical protein K1T71_005840 [Dendrolimus kikuchii]
MGGKTKQAQRTKNNVRPSSSGRSVEILNKMNLDPGLMMGSGNSLPTLFPTLTALSLDSGLNPEYQMCMKKLNKKDPITRTKALQELLELVNKSQVEDVVQALPSWTYFYKILTADTDRKVREMTQICHGAIVAACGRQVAPHLKQLLPAWLQAQYDDHAPAQTHAQKSLNSTFPDKKLPEVMSFCKAEVMAHFLSSLIGNADLTLIKKPEDAEERELQQCRIVAGSLQGLQYFSQHLPAAHERWLWAELAPLLQSGLFWKHASSPSPTLRAAWYAALGRIIERFKSTFGEKYGAKSIRLLLGAANEQNSLVAAQLWGCLLLFMHNVEDWHKYLDKKNLLCKRILDVLENGGWGDAKHLSNILLPLLAHLPEELLSKDYYESFFAAMFAGLDKKTILSSKSERQYWIASLADCLRYLSIQQNDYVVEVASYVHRTWLKNILNSTESQAKTNLIKWSANNMASLVKYWLKQSKETNTEHYEQLVRNFWQNIGSTITMQIETVAIDNDEISKLVNDHITLIQTLSSSALQETKKQHSIKFDDSLKIDDIASIPNQQCDISIIERYKHNLDLLVELTCLHYFDFMRSKQVCGAVLTPLFTLLVEFDSRRLFDAIARQYDFDGAYKLYDNVLRTWLSGDTMRCKVLVDVVFLILKHLSEEEQKAVFNSFQQFPPPVVEWCISLSAAHPHSRSAAARAWLRGRIVRAALAHVCRRLVAEGDCSRRNLLLMCLSQDARGELIIGNEAVSSIVEIFSDAITDSGLGTLEQCAAHAACLATTLQQQHQGHQYTKLVVNLFQLNILVPRGDSRLSLDTWCEVRSSWQDGLAALGAAEKQFFMEQAIRIIHENAFQDQENISVNKLEHIVSMCPYLLDREEITSEKIIDYVSITKRLFDSESESVLIETYALRNDCVLSNFNCPYDGTRLEPDMNELDRVDLIAYVNRVLFRASYLRTMLLLRDDDERHLCDTLLSDGYFEMEFCKLAYDFGIVSSLCEGYTFWLHYALIEETKRKLATILEEIINEAQTTRTRILSKLTGLAASEGRYWATARAWCESRVEGTLGEHQPQDFSLENAITGNGFIHTLQANAKQSRDEEVVYRTKYLVMLRSLFASDAELAEEARAQLAREAAEGLPGCSLDVVVNAYYMHNHIMLYERDLSDVSWRQVLSNAAIVEFLVEMVEQRGWDAPAHHWDFTTITLCSLLTSIDKSKHHWGSTKISMLARSVLRLLISVRRFVGGVTGECLRRQPTEHVAHLPTEWADIFAPDLNHSLFSILLHILESSTEVVTCNRVHVLAPLSRVQWEGAPREPALLRRAAAACARALARPHHHAYKYLAYYALRALAKPLQTCAVAVGSDSHALALGWLLLADAVAAQCALAKGDLAHHYIYLYRESCYAEPLMLISLRLLPAEVFAYVADRGDAGGAAPPHARLFAATKEFDVYEPARSEDVGALACRCVCTALGGAACAGVRGWWGAAAPRPARLLQRLVRAYVAPHLLAEQFAEAQRKGHQLGNAEVRVHQSSNEVACVFTVDERPLELRLTLSRDHPLVAPAVAALDTGAPGANTHWLALYLAYQNGTVLNALRLWTHAVAAKVSSCAQCYICYCRLHPTTGTLPRAACRQCKNKFHLPCVQKWFTTSKTRNCPLCRGDFYEHGARS